MKTRIGFVSNSSSTSFVGFGFSTSYSTDSPKEILEKSKEFFQYLFDKYDISKKQQEQVLNATHIYQIFEGLENVFVDNKLSFIQNPYDSYMCYVLLEFNCKSLETLKEDIAFCENTENIADIRKLAEVFGCDMGIVYDCWYDG